MSLVWFTPPMMRGTDLAETLARLDVLGIRWRAWSGTAPTVVYSMRDGVLVAEIGIITVTPCTGEIDIWPYDGIGAAESLVLAGCAQRAFEQPPTKAGLWRYSRRNGRSRWQASFFVRVDEGDGIGELVARHAQTMRQSVAASLGPALADSAVS